VTRRTDEGERVGVTEFGQVVLVPPLPTLIEINRLQKIAARRDIGSSTGPEVGDRKLLLRRFGQEQVSDGDMGEVGDGLDLGESGIRQLIDHQKVALGETLSWLPGREG